MLLGLGLNSIPIFFVAEPYSDDDPVIIHFSNYFFALLKKVLRLFYSKIMPDYMKYFS